MYPSTIISISASDFCFSQPLRRSESAMDEITMKDDKVRLPVPVARLFKWNVAMSVFHTTFAVMVLAAGKVDLKMPM